MQQFWYKNALFNCRSAHLKNGYMDNPGTEDGFAEIGSDIDGMETSDRFYR